MTSDRESEAKFFRDRQAWRSWLEKNHETEKGIWLLLYKKKVGKGMNLDEAVEEALCFGWIDSQLRRIDDKKHMLRFTPRRPGSVWAESNLRRVEKLKKEGRMTAKGVCLVPGEEGRERSPSEVREGIEPSDLKAALDASPKAAALFRKSSKSRRIQYIYWIISAKRPETRARRVIETVRLMERETSDPE